MCTVSWLHEGGGYTLFCNRDEKRSRPAARAPEVRVSAGVRYLAPVDSGRGGTWISVNESGVVLCLLNGAVIRAPGAHPAAPGGRSRGLVVAALAGVRGVDAIADALEELELDECAPFTLVALEPGAPASVAEWDGRSVSHFPKADEFAPLTSSSHDPGRVRESRLAEYARLTRGGGPTAQALMEFHRSHAPAAGAYSTCMHREDAHTVSFSRVTVNRERVRFDYTAGAPCCGEARAALSLPLAR
jgi:hypothetical protein